MSRTWRNSWGPELKARDSRVESKNSWKRGPHPDLVIVDDFKEEEAVSISDPYVKVFVIINEWTDIANYTSSEVTGGKWFPSEDEAWDALDLIAEAHSVELGQDETSFVLEDHKAGLQTEEYRIEELTRG